MRAFITPMPEGYRWSSVHANLGHMKDDLVTPHPVYEHLGIDDRSRREAYRHWLYEPLLPEDVAAIRAHLRQERALGDERFQAMVAKAVGRPVAVRRPGRARVERV